MCAFQEDNVNVDVSVLADAIGRTLMKEAQRLRAKGKRLVLVLEDMEVRQ